MPIFKRTVNAEVRVIVRTDQDTTEKQKALIMLDLEQKVNAESYRVKIIDGVAVQASLRLHLKDMKDVKESQDRLMAGDSNHGE